MPRLSRSWPRSASLLSIRSVPASKALTRTTREQSAKRGFARRRQHLHFAVLQPALWRGDGAAEAHPRNTRVTSWSCAICTWTRAISVGTSTSGAPIRRVEAPAACGGERMRSGDLRSLQNPGGLAELGSGRFGPFPPQSLQLRGATGSARRGRVADAAWDLHSGPGARTCR